MLNLDLEQLNCVVALTFSINSNSDFEKYYIYTNNKGMEYFDAKMKVDNADVYNYVFLEEFAEGLLHNFNKNSIPSFVPYGEILDEETVKKEHKKIVMGFKCDNWETAHMDFQREYIIEFLKEKKVDVELHHLSDNEIFSHLKEYVINIFNEYFDHNNVFISAITKEEYQSLCSGNSNSFVFYLERVNLYEKLQSYEGKNNMLKNNSKSKNKI